MTDFADFLPEADKPKPGIDLGALSTTTACDKGYEMELLHPATAAPLGVFISVVGRDSTVFRRYIRDKANERLRMQATSRARIKNEVTTVEQAEAEVVDLIAACTTGWRTGDVPSITRNGNALEFSPANARVLYQQETWIREQADEAIGDLNNFFGN